jgi:hypothetical protein
MTPEEERLAELLGRLGERHVATGADGAWLRPRLRRARFRRSMVAAAAASVAVVAIAGGVAATSRDPKAEPVPPAASPTPASSVTPSPAANVPLFVSAIGVRPDGSGAAVVGPCLETSLCDVSLRRTANGGRTLDAAAAVNLPSGPSAPRPSRVTAAGRFGLYLWAPGGAQIAWSNTNGYTWSEAGLEGAIADVAAAPDSDSVWITMQSCGTQSAQKGCPLRLAAGRVGQDPRSFSTLRLPVTTGAGAAVISRQPQGRAVLGIGQPDPTGGGEIVLVTEDDGQHWSRTEVPCRELGTGAVLVDVSLAPDGAVWALCGGDGGAGQQLKQVYVASELGRSFQKAGALPGRGYAGAIAAASGRAAWMSGARGPVLGTVDGGTTWSEVTEDSDFSYPVQVLADGTALAPGQVDGHGVVWIGTGSARWTPHPVRGLNLGPEFTDCNALQPGDDLDYGALYCDSEQVQVSTMDCSTGIYVRIVRPNTGDLEGITGVTPTWRAAEPIDPRYGRTPYAFHNCFEEEAGGLAFATASPTRSAPDLWPADADGPVAGACGTAEGRYATVEANPDVPQPRCTIVRADQRLRVRNTTNRFNSPGEVITVQFAGYPTRTVAIGEETVFERPMGEYLAPGVHDVHLSVYRGSGGAEIWLKS